MPLSSNQPAPSGRMWKRRVLRSLVVIGAIHVLVAAAILTAAGSSQSSTPQPAAPLQQAALPAPVPAPGLTALPVRFLRPAPDIVPGATPPHGPRGPCRSCHRFIQPPVSNAQPAALGTPAPGSCTGNGAGQLAAGPPAATAAAPTARPLKMMPFQEAHWQGLELISYTPAMSRLLKLPRDARGVVVDEATMPADMQGFLAGDMVTAVEGVPTPSLEAFVDAAHTVRQRRRVKIDLLRKGGTRHTLVLAALTGDLGTANGETAPMIPAGSRPPHGYLGPCTSCHHIGNTGVGAVDLGDPLTKQAPAIRAGQTRPHRDRGQCTACHTILR